MDEQAPVAELVRHPLRVGRNVWLLGLTSLFTDISSEMVASILPAYLVLHLGMSPLVFGAVDGLYQGIGSLVRWIGGAAADRSRRHKEIATAGYALSAFCRLMLLFAASASAIAAIVALDRIGKGLRTAPRDALISLSVSRAKLGTAFGLHRALDACGGLVGPLVAFLVLAATPRAFDQVFVVSFSVALVGVAVIGLLVENVAVPAGGGAPAGIVDLIREPLSDRRFRRTLMIGGLLALTTVSDAFVYLLLQRVTSFGPEVFPLLAAGTAAFYAGLSAPAGWLADRVGRPRVFIGGHAALLVLYGLLGSSSGTTTALVVSALLLGSYYAATDGVLAAAASAVLEPRVRATGLALLGTATSVARLLASFAFGWLWTVAGATLAIATFGVALATALAVATAFRHHLEPARP